MSLILFIHPKARRHLIPRSLADIIRTGAGMCRRKKVNEVRVILGRSSAKGIRKLLHTTVQKLNREGVVAASVLKARQLIGPLFAHPASGQHKPSRKKSCHC